MSNLKEAAKLALEALTSGVTDSKTRRHASEIAIASLTAALALPVAQPVATSDDVQDAVYKALLRAWQLGQTYWQQADSDSTCQQNKSDATQHKFSELIEKTRAMLATTPPPATAPESVRLTDEEIEAIGLAATKAGGRNMPMVFARAIEDAIHAKAGKS